MKKRRTKKENKVKKGKNMQKKEKHEKRGKREKNGRGKNENKKKKRVYERLGQSMHDTCAECEATLAHSDTDSVSQPDGLKCVQ